MVKMRAHDCSPLRSRRLKQEINARSKSEVPAEPDRSQCPQPNMGKLIHRNDRARAMGRGGLQQRRCLETKILHDIKRKQRRSNVRAKSGNFSMLTFQLIGAAFLVLCLAPLLARDSDVRRSSR
jgi:hypothetical protein